MGIFLLLLIIVIIYLLMVMPCLDRRVEMSEYLNIYYAHRGLNDNKNGIPENSLAAFNNAVLYGYGIELDVLVTIDDVVVAVHDNNLMRLCGVNIRVSESTYDEISRLKILNSNQTIPKLRDVLDLVDDKVPLIVELKISRDIKRNCKRTAEVLDSYSGQYCVQSFNPFMIQWFKKHRPKVLRGQIYTNFFKSKLNNNIVNKFMYSFLLYNFISRPDFIAFDIKNKNMLSLRLNKLLLNTPLFAWTIRNQEQLDEIKGIADSYIFEHFIPPK